MADRHEPYATGPISLRTFTRWVYETLRHLYDFPALERDPLVDVLGDTGTGAMNRAQSLRRLLLENIHAMRPDSGVPSDAPDWRSYRIMQMRFVEGLTPEEAMERLALQKSQFYHEQGRAIGTLASRLWELRRQLPHADSLEHITQAGLIRTETERLSRGATWEDVDVGLLLRELRGVVEPLARARGVTLVMQPCVPFTARLVTRVLLRQAILQCVVSGMDLFPGGALEISNVSEASQVGLRIHSWGQAAPADPAVVESLPHRLATCKELVATLGGHLDCGIGQHGWVATLTWAIAAQPVILVIDDNQGFVDLFRRYLAGYPYQVVGVRDGTQARETIPRVRPAVIILDVLMPQEDGWELLLGLKADANTRRIPVIVCSVLPESDIALSLGAAAYLSKPVTEHSLVEVLARSIDISSAAEPRA